VNLDADAIVLSREFTAAVATARANAERLIARDSLRLDSASRAPMAAHAISSLMYYGTMGSRNSVAAGRPMPVISSRSRRAIFNPVSMSCEPSSCRSLSLAAYSSAHFLVVNGARADDDQQERVLLPQNVDDALATFRHRGATGFLSFRPNLRSPPSLAL
jgi:hypothetical protein